MQQITLTPTELKPNKCLLRGVVWRAVENQFETSTRKLVDSDSEHDLLEDMLENSAKPPVPKEAEGLHYLLSTPFRYKAAQPYGSRFRPPGAGPGVFYASEDVTTAMAEVAYYRLKFFRASCGTPLPRQGLSFTVFAISYETAHGLDLTKPSLNTNADLWTAKDDYSATQHLASVARDAGIQAIRYTSVRDPHGNKNVALLDADALADSEPMRQQQWSLQLSREEATFYRPKAMNGGQQYTFLVDQL